MATNGNNLEQKFDALLGAYVKKQGAADRATCTQFDLDTASAYLERALTKNALIAFEEHLAGCASCRRCLIELARLMPAPIVTAENISVAGRHSLRERLSEWFTGWHLGMLAGVGVAAAAVLLVAIVLNRPEEGTMTASVSKEQLVVNQASSTPSIPPSAGQAEVDKIAKTTASATPVATGGSRGNTNSPAAPTPLAESQVAATSAAAPPPPASATKSDAERKEVATNQVGQIGGVAATQNQARNYQNLTPSGPSANQAQPERAPERAKREAPATVADAAAPPPAPKPQERAAEQDQKVDDKAATEARRDELAARKSANEEEGQSTARAKAVPRAPVGFVTSARSSRQVRNIGSKSFRLENGSWTDTEYDAGKGLPVIRLQHNSEEYRQTLKEIPGLNPYFNLKTVIVVWQGKVYRVEKK